MAVYRQALIIGLDWIGLDWIELDWSAGLGRVGLRY